MIAKSSTRLVSLDIFRGMTIAFMIIVNTPGSWKFVYPPLRHAEWHGCTPTDLVFPFFLFIVGVSIWFSMRKYGHELNSGSIFRILRRTVTIFMVGLLLGIFPYFFDRDYSQLRIMGVLQRIAMAYGIGALSFWLVYGPKRCCTSLKSRRVTPDNHFTRGSMRRYACLLQVILTAAFCLPCCRYYSFG